MIEEIFTHIGNYALIFLFIAGWIAVPLFLYSSYQNKRKREWVESQEFHLVKISVPKDNEKGPLSAEQMFASLHGIFKPHTERKEEGSLQEHISFEIASIDEKISFYVWLPVHLKDFIEGQIYAQYPKAEFEEVADYADKDFSDYHVVGTEIILNKNEVLPIKTFLNFEEVDPLSGVTSVLSKIDEPNDNIWIQVLIKPVDDDWHKKGLAYVNAVREGRSPEVQGFGSMAKDHFSGFAKDLLKAAVTPPEEFTKAAEPPKLASTDEAKLKAIEEKVSKLGYSVKIRLGYLTKDSDLSAAKIKLRSLIGAFKQFNTTNLNGFQGSSTVIGEQFIKDYKSRLFLDEGYILNIEEVASIFHLPNVSVETPSIGWTGSKKGEPPANLPIEKGDESDKELSIFAETNFRHRKYRFGIKTDDRRRHMYLMGKTGVGKTNMMENMVISDIRAGHGVGIVDPHGEFIERILKYIPKERINDVILFDPSDNTYPIAFNPLEIVNEDQKTLVTSGLISIFQRIWADSWGPRLEYILRNTIISLLDYPGSTMLGILKILVDKNYRDKVLKKITDPVILDFWNKEFAQYNDKTRTEAILPIQNKVGQFLSSHIIRNIVGQPKSKIDMRDIMDNKKILLLKLSQGKIGEDNSSLLGAMMITKIQLAAMSRADVPEEERVDFYLYVDEFQNFANESFAKILSEARKYRLDLTLANQYIAQLKDTSRSETIKNAIFGNIGSMVCFRVGASDAKDLVKEVEPVFDENDLVNLDKYHIYTKLSIDGITGNAFSAKTFKIPDPDPANDYSDTIIKGSREKYATSREIVEEKIADWSEADKDNKNGEIGDGGDDGKSYAEYLDKLKDKAEESADNKDIDKKEESKKEFGDNNKEKNKDREEVAAPKEDKASKIKELTSKIVSHNIRTEKETLKEAPKENISQDNVIHKDIDNIRSKLDELEKNQNTSHHKHLKTLHKEIEKHKEIKPGDTVEFK